MCATGPVSQAYPAMVGDVPVTAQPVIFMDDAMVTTLVLVGHPGHMVMGTQTGELLKVGRVTVFNICPCCIFMSI